MSPPAAPEEAYAAALAGLPKLTPAALAWLLDQGRGAPSEAWQRVLLGQLDASSGVSGSLVAEWRRSASSREPREELARCRAAGVEVVIRGTPSYPCRLAEDPEAPAVLFVRGDLGVLDLATVALVGTRRCTGYGRQMAQVLGHHLSERGVAVVSGMATGIDASAQAGALGSRTAPVVGVAGSGLDCVYPESSRTLWERLGREGLLLSETGLGQKALPQRFPWRNRIMAGLADVVVVVESHIRGGSLGTVKAASDRGTTVMAVPGPVTSEASAGTNALIADGCPLVRDATDIEVALGLRRAGRKQRPSELVDVPPPRARRPRQEQVRTERLVGRPAAPSGSESALLEHVDVTPTSLELLMARTGRRAGEIALLLDGLEQAGLVTAGPGWWQRSLRQGGR